ncbi:MAG: Hsp70 family protein, partial [Ilumatobacteraceae bacterium]
LSEADIEKMVKDAEAHAEEDRQRRDEAEVRNNADSLMYQGEKVLRDNAEKVSDADKTAIQDPIAEVKTAMVGNDVAAIRAAHEKLSTALQSFSQRLYEAAARDSNAAGTSATGQNEPSGAADDDEIIDAEIVDDEGK